MDEKKPISWRDYFGPDFVSDDDSSFVFGRGTKGAGQQMMLEARGWGYLNGQRCGLSEEDTIEVQRQILEVAVNALKEAWAGQTVIERLTKENKVLLEYVIAEEMGDDPPLREYVRTQSGATPEQIAAARTRMAKKLAMKQPMADELAALRAEVARLTPTATRELPTKEGWYWRGNEAGEIDVVQVRTNLDGSPYMESTDDDGTVVIDLVLHGKWWSREPIPEMQIPEEGERMSNPFTGGEDVLPEDLHDIVRQNDAFKIENVELRERVTELEMLIEFYKPSFQLAMDATLGDVIEGIEARKQLAQRDAEIAELRQYRKYLEWMIAHSARVFASRTRWWVEWYSSKQLEDADRETDLCPTPHEAIDAAIEATGEKA